ncbi:MAG: hypothetical protein U0457_00445 [Candidatus Sericytochromatia bacterium]
MKKFLYYTLTALSLFVFSEATNNNKANAYSLTNFKEIRTIEITPEERASDIINFDEFMRIHYFNYISKKNEKDKNKLLVKLNSDIANLKYSKNYIDKKPPLILHWTAGNTAMGAILTLFKERKGMKEGLIGVDYVVTEPLIHPDYPDFPPKSYSVKFTKSESATTWFHVPNNSMPEIKEQDRKYNKALSIEIVGWRFLKNEKGKNESSNEIGKMGIRENFDGNYEEFENLEDKYLQYPTVIKLANYLAEKYNFANLIDEFEEEKEIDPVLKEKGILYLNGPLSEYIKGHGLVAVEHTLMFNSSYIREKQDFTPKELLVFYNDLKNYRSYKKDLELVRNIEERILNTDKLSKIEFEKNKEFISNIKSKKQKEYLTMALDINNLKINTLDKINLQRKEIDAFSSKQKEKLTSFIISKFINESDKIQEEDYTYLKKIIVAFKNYNIREKISQQLYDRYAYNNKKKNS